MSSIDLGFAQPLDPKLRWKMKNKFFPSKIGGKPVFLALKGLPKNNVLKCDKCSQMLRFLLQVYAPIDHKDNAFHRTLYIFCCPNNDCSHFKVLRSQLSRNNPYYSSEPPDYESDDLSYNPNPQAFGCQLCAVCGLPADKKCSKCAKVSYCCKEHQIIDWKEGQHKVKCGTDPVMTSSASDQIISSALFTELELIIGDNGSSSGSDSEEGGTDSESEAKEMHKLNELLTNRCPEYQKQNLDNYEDNVDEDQKVFSRFKRMSSGEVLRYCSRDNNHSNVEPLWVSNQNKPNLPIPKCLYCGSDRRFEFQVMPQILNKIVDSEASLDWGTLVIYTCSQSCSIDSQEECQQQYREEYLWKQPLN